MLLARLIDAPLPGEKVVLYLHNHWYRFFKVVSFYALLMIMPVVIGTLLLRFYPDLWDKLFNGALLEVLLKLALSFYYLSVWLFFWSSWVDHYLDIWIITNERILTFEQRGLFNRATSELRLARVQDVSAQVKGLAGTVLNFGVVRVQTAGAASQFIFDFVSNPHKIAEQILQLADASRGQPPLTV